MKSQLSIVDLRAWAIGVLFRKWLILFWREIIQNLFLPKMMKIILKVSYKSSLRGYRDGSVVKSMYATCRGPKFSSTRVRQLTNAYNSSSRGSDAFFWPPWVPALMCVHTHMNSRIIYQIKKKDGLKTKPKNPSAPRQVTDKVNPSF